MTLEKWQKLSFVEQIGNIGSEAGRALRWQEKKDNESKNKSAWRLLELIDLTVADSRWRGRLFEILRLREVLCDKLFGGNNYGTTAKTLEDYFLYFGLLARK